MRVSLHPEEAVILFVQALIISGGSKDSAAACAGGRVRSSLQLRKQTEPGAVTGNTNEMLDLFVFSPDTPQMSHPAKHRLPVSGAN